MASNKKIECCNILFKFKRTDTQKNIPEASFWLIKQKKKTTYTYQNDSQKILEIFKLN